ncbi:DUF4097 family beta strand repeat-containing protein [Amycolatopsis sp. cg5]|uniref:DUF4097 family beta strand repeat-containing protein n=1 Tax=Amycolatopsis sp. cg5 TaxID=3238802 RepID=UPI003524C0BC
MKKLLFAAAAGVLVLSGCGVATEKIDDGGPIAEQVNSVRFDVPVGDVHVRVEDGAPVSVRRQITFKVSRPGQTYRVENGTLVLSGCGDNCGIVYDVVLPRELAITGVTGTGHVQIDRAVNVDVRSDVGDIKAYHVSGVLKARVHTGDIDMSLSKPGGVWALADVGDVTVTVPTGGYKLKASAEVGKTEITVPNDQSSPNELDVNTGTGTVTVKPA